MYDFPAPETEVEPEPDTRASETALVRALEEDKERAVRHKLSVEQRWIEDERQYWGFRQDDVSDEGEEEETPPLDNKTQAKVDISAARCGDMMFPTNDRNWALKNTPDPTDIDGEPIEAKVAEQAVKRAEEKIEDHLVESHYAKHGRQAIFDACKLGIGVMKGPFPRSSTRRVVRRRWEPLVDEFGQPVMDMDEMGQPVMDETGQPMPAMEARIELQIVQETKPGSVRVDPWMFFPLPCRSMDECEGTFEMHLYPKIKFGSLADHPGFDPEVIRDLLKAGPKHSDQETSLMRERRRLLTSGEEEFRDYIVWEYHGPIDADQLRDMGYEVGEDPLDRYYGEAWFCRGRLLKLELNAILGDERVPYYVIPYKRDDADIMNSWGIARVMRDDQRSIDIVYEAMQYNARLCSGPQSIHWEGRAVPADGSYQIKGPKHWRVTDETVESIDQVIQFRNVPSVIGQLMPMYELAKANADENTQLPLIAQGEATNTVPTASGMAMVMNAQNVVQRRFAHAWDDEITIPMLTRYYWWLMEFDDEDEIKVEMEVQPRGASYLLVKDMQAQHGMMVLQLAGQDPELRQRMKMDEAYDIVFNFLDVPTDRLFKTDDELAEEQNSPEARQRQQMQQRAAEAELAEAEGKAAKAQAEAAKAEAELQAGDQGPDQKAMLEYERDQMRYEQEMAEIEARLIMAQMERDSRLAQAAANQEVKLADIMARLEIADQDRAMKATLEQMQLRQREAAERRKDFHEGMRTRIQMERKQLRDRQYDLRERNIEQGHDSF